MHFVAKRVHGEHARIFRLAHENFTDFLPLQPKWPQVAQDIIFAKFSPAPLQHFREVFPTPKNGPIQHFRKVFPLPILGV